MSIAKNKLKRNFTMIPNGIITDERLSKGALQLYLYIASKPDNWKIHNSEITKSLKIGSRNTLAKYWKELIKSNWVSRIKETNKQGQFTGSYDYTINTEIAKSDTSDIPKSQKHRNRKNTEIAKSDTYNNTDLFNNTDLEKDKLFLFFKEIYKKYNFPKKSTEKGLNTAFKENKAKFMKIFKTISGNSLKANVENYLEYLKVATWRGKMGFSVFINKSENYNNDWTYEITEALKKNSQKTKSSSFEQQKVDREKERLMQELGVI